MRFYVRSLFIVLTVSTVTMAIGQFLGASLRQAVLVSLPVGFFAASLATLYLLARNGSGGSRNVQLLVILAIELVLVPIGSAAAIAAYFLERQ